MVLDDVAGVYGVARRALKLDAHALPAQRAGQDERWHGRLEHLLGTDTAGCWVAERQGMVIGAALGLVREGVWGLSLLVVDPVHQSGGTGAELLRRALAHARGTTGQVIISSSDSRALRLYAGAGFGLRGALAAHGYVHGVEPAGERPAIEEVPDTHLEELGDISQTVRGGTHAPDLREMRRTGAWVLRAGDRGFVVHGGGQVLLLAARDEQAARALLWSGLRSAGEGATAVNWMAAQDWAVEVALGAGLTLKLHGAMCVRGRCGPTCPAARTCRGSASALGRAGAQPCAARRRATCAARKSKMRARSRATNSRRASSPPAPSGRA